MRRLTLYLALSLTPALAGAQLEVSHYQAYKAGPTPQVTYFRTDSIAPNAKFFLWSLVNNGWAENVVGLDTKAGNLEVSAGAGVETTKSAWRVEGNLLYGSSDNYLYSSLETGASGPWYLFEVNSREVVAELTGSGRIGVGLRIQRFVGVGPRLEVELGKHFLVWTVPIAWDVENNNSRHGVVTLRYSP